ncbi:MAG: DUF3301 domain-containing protein [Frateuria sp.]|uniref:DUF3301 domain-containing protein n=1 Tax=Frateuria sp. TaxID=2211372 RepID=UPI0018589875|nr:DUF3301 domain-containing protein [Frateuria sp.]NUO74057.1 DUF3301 domain-containing protein [Frateuria sp.]NUR23784.1 DUF3301 domain-containing protein [Frateuria sp.]
MSQVSDLIALLAFAAVAGLWFKSTRARERAVDEARRQCMQHDLQLLDETVGLRSLRLRQASGRRQLELGYGFEVSAHGDDRQEGRLWMRGGQLAGVSLPGGGEPLPHAVEPSMEAAEPLSLERHGNVIPLRPRRPPAGQ